MYQTSHFDSFYFLSFFQRTSYGKFQKKQLFLTYHLPGRITERQIVFSSCVVTQIALKVPLEVVIIPTCTANGCIGFR